MSPDLLIPRLRDKFTVSGGSECWLWTAAKDPRGYGRVRRSERRFDGQITAFAHRYIYELLVGDPGALDLDHLCRTPSCVNPAHLEPVTHAENVRRGRSSETLRAKYAERRSCPRGHPLEGANLYEHRTRKGYVNRQCRTCRTESVKRQRARQK